MVTNTELTIDQITEEALIILKNKLAFGNRCLRQFDSSFGDEGAKIGDNLRVRVPVRTQTTTGPAPSQTAFVETYKPVAAQTQRNVLLSFSSKELALAIDEFSERVIEPQIVQLASDMDTDGTLVATSGYTITNSGYVTANYAGQYAGFSGLVTPGPYTNGVPSAWTGAAIGSAAIGVAGAPPQANASLPFAYAKAVLDNQAAPKEDRYTIISPDASASLVPNLFNLFNPSSTISEMFEEGMLNGGNKFLGAQVIESPSVQNFTSGTWKSNVGATVYVASNAGDTTLAIGNVGNNAIVVSGDQFVVSGVYTVNPLTRQSSGKLQVFTAVGLATANASGTNTGNVVVSVYPPIQNSGAYQTVSALPGLGSAVTFMGTSNTLTQTLFSYQKNAIAMVVAPLAEDLDGAKVSRRTSEEDNLSIRFVSQYQSLTDQVVKRLDILYGWAVVRPELGCLIKG